MNLLDPLIEMLYANCNIYMLVPRNLGGMASARTFVTPIHVMRTQTPGEGEEDEEICSEIFW